jgi:hypothetical protein
MRVSCNKLYILTVFMLLVCGQGRADANPTSIAASALFDRFETVLYAKRDIVASAGTYNGLSAMETATLHYPFWLLPEALDSLGKQAAAEILRNSEAVLVGAKDFRAPAGLGEVRSQVCYVVILNKEGAFKLRNYFTKVPSASAAGSPVWNWSAKLGEFGRDDPKPSSLYATQIAHAYLLVSNNLKELQAVAGRLAASNQDLEPLTRLRDWESISQHPLWGYRRYRHTEVVNPVAAGMSDVTRGAEAIMFFADFEKKVGVLSLLSSVTDEGTPAKINAKAVLPPFKPRGPGVWETVTMFSGDEDSFERMFAVMYLFGFGTYV